MATLLSSKTFVREAAPGVRLQAGGNTAVTAMVGLTEKGPVATPTLSTSFEEWKEVYGGYTLLSGDTVANIQGFFEEGGQQLWFSRTAHWIDINDASRGTTMLTSTVNLQTLGTALTAATILGNRVGTFAIPSGSVLKIFVDGAGSTTDITFTEATSASVTSTIAATVDLTATATITLDIDNAGSASVTFIAGTNVVDIAAVTRAEIVDGLNTLFTGTAVETATGYTVTSTTRGVTSEIDITVAGANTGLTVATVNGVDNDMNNATAATITEVVAAITAASGITSVAEGGKARVTSSTTGASSQLDVDITVDSIVADALGLPLAAVTGTALVAAVDTLQVDAKYPGLYGDSITVAVTAATSGLAAEFNLQVYTGGVIRNTFPNLTMNTAEAAVNATDGSGDGNIAVVKLTTTRPGNIGETALTGGSDGDPVDDSDFIGVTSEENGLTAFDDIAGISLLCVPARITATLAQAMLTWAAGRNLEVFVILDTPPLLTAQGAVSYVVDNSLEASSEFGAIYWPHVKVRNPSTTVFGTDAAITIPQCGLVAGRYARTDASRDGGIYDASGGNFSGVYRTAVGLELLPGKLVPESDNEAKRDLVAPHRINPVSSQSGQIALDGVNTLLATGDFPKINQRRGASYIGKITREGLEIARFRNINEDLIAEIDRAVRSFLTQQTKLNAFASTTPDEAFLVDTGKGVNTVAINALGIVRVRIGLAMANPAEFIEIIISGKTLTA